MSESINLQRRKAIKLGLFATGATLASTSIGIAQSVCRGQTPTQPEGPFYPIKDQPDKDMDLVTVQGRSESAKGNIIFVQGIVSDPNCKPVSNALVEIWQACASGKYNHTSDPNPAELDPNFQYWGKAVTNESGFYKFRTIIPGAYPADENWIRPPHIHFKVQRRGYMELITQMYFSGQELNDKDLILNRIKPEDKAKVIVPLIEPSDSLYPVANFNITLEKP